MDGVFQNSELMNIISRVSKETNVPSNIILAVAQQETGGKWYDSVSDGTAYSHGYMMLYDNGALAGLSPEMKEKAKTDHYTNVLVGAQLLASNYQKYGNWKTAIKRYNGSGAAADRYADTVWTRANSDHYVQYGQKLDNGRSYSGDSGSGSGSGVIAKIFNGISILLLICLAFLFVLIAFRFDKSGVTI